MTARTRREVEKRTVGVMFACNDYRNGNRTAWVDAVEIPDWIRVEGPRLHYGTEVVRASVGALGDTAPRRRWYLHVGRSHYYAARYQTWVGNWCWDLATLSLADANRLFEMLRRRGWGIEEGASGLFDRWQSHEPLGLEARLLAELGAAG